MAQGGGPARAGLQQPADGRPGVARAGRRDGAAGLRRSACSSPGSGPRSPAAALAMVAAVGVANYLHPVLKWWPELDRDPDRPLFPRFRGQYLLLFFPAGPDRRRPDRSDGVPGWGKWRLRLGLGLLAAVFLVPAGLHTTWPHEYAEVAVPVQGLGLAAGRVHAGRRPGLGRVGEGGPAVAGRVGRPRAGRGPVRRVDRHPARPHGERSRRRSPSRPPRSSASPSSRWSPRWR